jgi:hypothetical protein
MNFNGLDHKPKRGPSSLKSLRSHPMRPSFASSLVRRPPSFTKRLLFGFLVLFFSSCLILQSSSLSRAESKKTVLPGPSADSWPCRDNFRIVDGVDSDIVTFARKEKVPPLLLLAWNPNLAEEGRVRRFREKRINGVLAKEPVKILICNAPFLRMPLASFESPYKLVVSRFAQIFTYPWAELGSRWRADVPPGKRTRMGPETCLTFARKPYRMRLRLDLAAPTRTQRAIMDVARVYGIPLSLVEAMNAKTLRRGFLTREDVIFLPFPKVNGIDGQEEDETEAANGASETEAVAPPGSLEPSGEETE